MRGKMNSAMAALAMGSAMLHPVKRITAPATMTAAELTASPSTSRYALRTLRLSAAPRVEQPHAEQVHAEPHHRHRENGPPGTGCGCQSRSYALTRMARASKQSTTPLTSAARISTR